MGETHFQAIPRQCRETKCPDPDENQGWSPAPFHGTTQKNPLFFAQYP
jgi:hypothetical protein